MVLLFLLLFIYLFIILSLPNAFITLIPKMVETPETSYGFPVTRFGQDDPHQRDDLTKPGHWPKRCPGAPPAWKKAVIPRGRTEKWQGLLQGKILCTLSSGIHLHFFPD
ncbi:hypothetical protein AVEN_27250-1 [Araneus ventricosus]|uniref:Uncharacterized protein n=1 Tax=Araneus ventricosus TaxID=182803 RepID=A0A4Y2C9M4_ARAVE|nr:hypothetical protein AVEN_27250-1 [Araneus ventricosus]